MLRTALHTFVDTLKVAEGFPPLPLFIDKPEFVKQEYSDGYIDNGRIAHRQNCACSKTA